MDRENIKLHAELLGLRVKGLLRVLVACIGFAAIAYGAYSAYVTWQAVGGVAAVSSDAYLPQLVAVDLIVIFTGAAIVMIATR